MRRTVQFGLEDMCQFTTLSDVDMDSITAEFVHNHPYGGQISLDGYLRGKGLCVQ